MNRFFQNAAILLHVINFVDAPTLLNLRLLNRFVNSLISSYESSITEQAARKLCQRDDGERVLDHHPTTLRDLFYLVRLNDLAIKAVASDQVPHIGDPAMQGILPTDNLGDEIRQKVRNGLIIISKLSEIYKELDAESSKTTTKGLAKLKAGWFRNPTSAQEAMESSLLRRWLEFLGRFPAADIVDLHVALWCIESKTTSDHQAKAGSPALWVDIMADREIEAIQWMTWYLARNGLGLIHRLWSENQTIANEAKSKIQADIKTKSNKTIRLEYCTCQEIWKTLSIGSWQPGYPAYVNWQTREASCYCESTFAGRIGPSHNGLPPDQLLLLREEVALQVAMSVQGNFGLKEKKGAWRNRKGLRG
ncbi:MAG: hypothetical protein Q9170_005790 [Blastenia crenularia]